MKNGLKFFLSLFSILILSIPCFSQEITLKQSNASGIYKSGEPVKVIVSSDQIRDSIFTVRIIKNNTLTIADKKVKNNAQELTIFNESIDGPASLVFEVKTSDKLASIGAVIAPDKFNPGFERPVDFDEFWDKEKRELRSLPMKVKKTPASDTGEGYKCFDIEINCTGPKPARGYFAYPEGAGLKSLPIVLYVHAAGVKGSWCLARPETALEYAKIGKGALSFDLNAHGMLNNQPMQYYNELEQGELKNYWHYGVEDLNNFYFRGMYLRLIRTLDFLASQPEWDGERILVIGESQGGGQALAAAGLDNRVTAVVATVPAMCDWGGSLAGRAGGWPDPYNSKGRKEEKIKVLPYFDVAHLLKNSKATLVTEIGFIDFTCPASSVYAAVNQAKGKKIILGVPYRAHHLTQKAYQIIWEKDVYKPKTDFISQFLR